MRKGSNLVQRNCIYSSIELRRQLFILSNCIGIIFIIQFYFSFEIYYFFQFKYKTNQIAISLFQNLCISGSVQLIGYFLANTTMFLELHNYKININKYIFNETRVVIGSKRVDGRNSHLPPILTNNGVTIPLSI